MLAVCLHKFVPHPSAQRRCRVSILRLLLANLLEWGTNGTTRCARLHERGLPVRLPSPQGDCRRGPSTVHMRRRCWRQDRVCTPSCAWAPLLPRCCRHACPSPVLVPCSCAKPPRPTCTHH